MPSAAWGAPCKGPWARVTLYGGAVVTVDALIVEAVMARNVVSQAYGYRATPPDTGAQNCRFVAGTSRWSWHAYGLAIDENWLRNPFGRPLRTDRPPALNQALHRIRTNNGKQVWYWGGYWSKPDAMHLEIMCTPQDLATGINWATVAGYGGKPPPYAPTPPPYNPKPTPKPTYDEDDDDMTRKLIRSDPEQGGDGTMIGVEGMWRHHLKPADVAHWRYRAGMEQNVPKATFNEWMANTYDAQNVNLAAFYAKAFATKK